MKEAHALPNIPLPANVTINTAQPVRIEMKNGKHIDLILDRPIILPVTALPARFEINEAQPVNVTDADTGEVVAFTLTRKMTVEIPACENSWDNGWNVCNLPRREA